MWGLRSAGPTRWVGRCPTCGEWGTVAEQAAPSPARARAPLGPVPVVTRLSELTDDAPARLATDIAELDRVSAAAWSPGRSCCIGGEPGIGKSTLVLQALAGLAAAGVPAMLVTGEESPVQVRGARRAPRRRLRAHPGAGRDPPRVGARRGRGPWPRRVRGRLGADAALATPSRARRARRNQVRAGHRRAHARRQGARHHDPARGPGHQGRRPRRPAHARAPGQLRRSPSRATTCAPTASCAPPRTASARPTRPALLRDAARPASSSVEDPTRLYLAEAGERVGSCVFPAIEGSRALLVEVQALVGHTEVVPPRRVAVGSTARAWPRSSPSCRATAGCGSATPTCS